MARGQRTLRRYRDRHKTTIAKRRRRATLGLVPTVAIGLAYYAAVWRCGGTRFVRALNLLRSLARGQRTLRRYRDRHKTTIAKRRRRATLGLVPTVAIGLAYYAAVWRYAVRGTRFVRAPNLLRSLARGQRTLRRFAN